MRKVFYSYLLREQAVPVFICLIGVSFVLITGQLLQLMRILFASSCSLRDIAEIVLLVMPKLFLYAAPMAVLLGVMLAFVRLNSDNELVAFRAVGTSFLDFLPPVLGVLVFAMLLSFFNVIYIVPLSNGAFELKLKSLGRASIPALMKEGTFISAIPKLVFFFKSVDHTDLSIKGVFVQDQRHPDEKVTITAESAQLLIPPDSKNITFLVENGVITRTAQHLRDAQAVSFKNYDFTLSMDDIMGAVEQGIKKKREMNLSEIYAQIQSAKERRSFVYWSLELHGRLAFPAACLLLGLLGPPLGSMFRQRSRMTGITIGVGIFLAYYVMLSAGKGLGENGVVSPFFAVWTPNLLCLLLSIYLWRKMHTEKPFSLFGLRALWSRRRVRSGTEVAAR
ncbi:MAG: LptF/LptG family permease [Syntrophobacteraceae bacterium]